MSYDRDELIEIGYNEPTQLLTDWGRDITGQAIKDLTRLSPRGVTSQYIAGIESLSREVTALEVAQEKNKKEVPASTFKREGAKQAAYDFREEVKGLAMATFDSEPDVLASFRTGVKLGQSTPKLILELERLTPLVREYGARLAPVARGREALIARGETVLADLRAAQDRHAAERRDIPDATAKLNEKKGDLYCRVRWLVRLGKVEFRKEIEHQKLYNYNTLRRGEVAAKGVKTREAKKETK